jgi:hypothetical protein
VISHIIPTTDPTILKNLLISTTKSTKASIFWEDSKIVKVLNKFKPHKMPQGSLLYERIMPALFLALGTITIGLIVFAIGVFTGLIAWV